ncbi:MAG: hypothetical protein MI919_02510, partial [Holophagales bacterium]|nr:hypothetical protein [Holophagales bacterium]
MSFPALPDRRPALLLLALAALGWWIGCGRDAPSDPTAEAGEPRVSGPATDAEIATDPGESAVSAKPARHV